MNDTFEPRYISVPVSALRTVSRLSKAERLAFIDYVWSAYKQIMNGNGNSSFPDSNLGDCMHETYKEITSGIKAYRARVFANPSGVSKDKTTPPNGYPNGYPNQINQNKSESEYNHQINQIRNELIAEGNSSNQIDTIIARTNLAQVNNPIAYIRKAIEAEKKKSVPAQNYDQRTYSEPRESMDEWIQRISKETGMPIPGAEENNGTTANERPP